MLSKGLKNFQIQLINPLSDSTCKDFAICYHSGNGTNNSVALLIGYNQVFFHPEVLNFLPIYFPHILYISGKPYLFAWEILDGPIFVCIF